MNYKWKSSHAGIFFDQILVYRPGIEPGQGNIPEFFNWETFLQISSVGSALDF